jgi:hypothetical protein
MLLGTTTSHLTLMADGSGNGGLYKENTGAWPFYYNGGNGGVGIMSSGTESGVAMLVNGVGKATSSFQAPIFYSTDSTYYGDFDSTADAALRVRGGALFGPNTTWGAYLLVGGDGRQNYTNSITPSVCATNGNLHIDAGSGYETFLNWYDGDTLRIGAGNSSGTALRVFGSSNYTEIYGSARSPLFYDLDNTAYYGDFAGTSNLNALTIANGITNSSSYVNNNQLGLYNASYGGYFYQYAGQQWAMSFNGNTDGCLALRQSYNGTVKIQMYYDTSGSGLLTNTGNWGVRMNYNGGASPGGTLYGEWIANGGMFAPIYYDSATTAYYVDPNSTSNLNTVNANILRSYSDIYTDSNYGYGHVGVYTSTRYQGVFAMGDAYKLPADGTTTGNLYGIAWSHPNAGGAAANLGSHGMLILENGTFKGAWGGGSLRTTGDIRATIYYDYDNTAYYLDPNSSSNLGTTLTGAVYFLANRNTSGDSPPLQVFSNNGGGAIMSFHRGGYYAVNFGLDSDNVMRIGGWSAPANLWQLDMSGNNYLLASSRAPVFYDVNDTTYYTDPNSAISGNFAGSLNAATYYYAGLRVNASGTGSAGGAIAIQQVTAEGWTGIFCDFEPYTEYGLWHDNPNNYFCFTGGSSTGNIRSFTVPSRASGNRTAYEKFRIDQNSGDTITGAISYAFASSRAPIFYDYDNTAFYTDPNNFSQMSYGNFSGAPSGRSLSLGGDQTDRVYNDTSRASLVINSGSYPHFYINCTTNIGNAYHGAVFSMTGNLTGGGFRRWGMGIANTDPDCWSWGYYDNSTNPHYSVGGTFGYTGTNAKMWLNTNGSLLVTGDMRAPIFYDTNTAYYVDPAGTSNLAYVNLASVYTGNKTSAGAGALVNTSWQTVAGLSVTGVYIQYGFSRVICTFTISQRALTGGLSHGVFRIRAVSQDTGTTFYVGDSSWGFGITRIIDAGAGTSWNQYTQTVNLANFAGEGNSFVAGNTYSIYLEVRDANDNWYYVAGEADNSFRGYTPAQMQIWIS